VCEAGGLGPPAYASPMSLWKAVGLVVLLWPSSAREAAGESPVGFEVLERRDPARPLKDSAAGRPLQISLWYPADSGASAMDAPRMRYRDYLLLGLSETSFAPPTPGAAERMLGEYRRFLQSTGIEPAETEALLDTPLQARRNARAARGAFPLVLLAPGNAQSADDMAALAERLAANGFLVASVPSPTRLSGPMASEADIPAKADEQATDLAFARHALAGRARRGRYAVAGHSFGARSALLLAMRDPNVAAVVSLDGGIGSKTGAGTLEKARGFSSERMRAPLLHFYEELDPEMAPDFALIRSLSRSERWIVKADGMHHVHFTSVGSLIASSPGLSRATAASPATGRSYDAVAETTLSFLAELVRGPGRGSSRWRPPDEPGLHAEHFPASR